MAQLPHVEATDTATDITVGLPDGCYVAQVAAAGGNGVLAVLYATAATAPTDDNDFFRAGPREFFTFTVGAGQDPTWCKTGLAGLPIPLALAVL